MLSEHLAAARRAMDPPWDARREAIVLERAIATRRASRSNRTIVWMLALAGSSLVAAVLGASGEKPTGKPAIEPGPATVHAPTDALDGGKQTG